MTTTDPLDERVRRCTGTDLRDPRRAATAARLLGEVLSRPTWSLHRHVHLVSAFEDARALAPIETVLTVGCGHQSAQLEGPQPEFLAALITAGFQRFHQSDVLGIAKRTGIQAEIHVQCPNMCRSRVGQQ